MKIISMNRLALSTFAICLLLASKTICVDESIMTSLQSGEEYSDDTYSEPIEDMVEEKQRTLNSDEPQAWGLKNIMKISTPTVNRLPNPAANLPLRFGRNFQEERSIKPAANLPLRFGRTLARSLTRQPLPFSHRFERAPSIPNSVHSLANLPLRFGRSAGLKRSKYGHFHNHMKRESDGEEGRGKNWEPFEQFTY